MTFREAVSFLLQTLEIGHVDEKDNVVQYKYAGAEPSFASALLFQTVERGIHILIKRSRYSWDEVLTDDDLELLYEELSRQLNHATLPKELGQEQIDEFRQEALSLLDDVIAGHKHLRQLMHDKKNK